MKNGPLRLLPAIVFAFIASAAMADTTKDAVLAWSEELRAAEAANPTDHPANYNSQTGSFYIGMFEAVNASTGSKWNSFSGTALPGNARADLAASYA